jgi:hypothetical protein
MAAAVRQGRRTPAAGGKIPPGPGKSQPGAVIFGLVTTRIPRKARRTGGVFSVTVDGEPAGSESWTLDRDGVTLRARSTISMRVPEPNLQQLDLAISAAGVFLKLEVVFQRGGGSRRAVVAREGDALQARVFEENAPAYENAFSAAGFEKVDFGSILSALPLTASGRIGPGETRELSALLLPLPDLLPLEVRQSFHDLGPEPGALADGTLVEARRFAQTTWLPEAGALESALWVDPDGVPVRQTLEHDGRRVEIVLLSREERPLPREIPVLRG